MELESDTEAVADEGFKLGCISCKRRGEVKAVAIVNWYFKALGEQSFSHVSGNSTATTLSASNGTTYISSTADVQMKNEHHPDMSRK